MQAREIVVPLIARRAFIQGASTAALFACSSSHLVSRDHAAYDGLRRGHNRRFDDVRPLAIARCRSTEEVARALAWARERGVAAVPRAGGHSYIGASLGNDALVVDVREMTDIAIDSVRGEVRVGGGALSIDVAAALDRHGLAIPLGTCPTVGVAGLTLGGGKGFASRAFGLTCDHLVEATVVLASGDVVVCDERRDAALFWALRGGGGGTFGVVTSLKFAAARPEAVSTFEISWPFEKAHEALSLFRHLTFGEGPDDVAARLEIGRGPGDRRRVLVQGQLVGMPEEVARRIAGAWVEDRSLLLDRDAPATKIRVGSMFDATLRWAECEGVDVMHCRQAAPESFYAKSAFFDVPLSDDALEHVVRLVAEKGSAATAFEGIQLDAQGGAIARLAADATAFVHRRAHACAQYLAFWNEPAPAEHVARARDWVTRLHAALQPFANGEAYQNYLDDGLTAQEWPIAYFGSNYARLRKVKAAYDPGRLFRGPQTV